MIPHFPNVFPATTRRRDHLPRQLRGYVPTRGVDSITHPRSRLRGWKRRWHATTPHMERRVVASRRSERTASLCRRETRDRVRRNPPAISRAGPRRAHRGGKNRTRHAAGVAAGGNMSTPVGGDRPRGFTLCQFPRTGKIVTARNWRR